MDQSTGVAVPSSITVTRDDDAVLVHLSGEIDASLRDAASRCMVEVVGCDRPVTIDTSQVTFIDSSGLAFLLQVQAVTTGAGRPLLLRDPSGAVLDLLALVGLHTLFVTEAPEPTEATTGATGPA